MTDIAVLGMQIDAKALDAGLERLEQAFARVGKSGDAMVAQVKTATGAVGKAMSEAMGGGTGAIGVITAAQKQVMDAKAGDIKAIEALELGMQKRMAASVVESSRMQRAAQVAGIKSALVLAESEASNSIASIGRRFAALTWEATRVIYGITALGTAALAPAIFGTKFQKDIEDSRVGITGILVAMTDLNGKATTINDAWRISGDIVRRLQADAIKYGISLDQVATTYRAIFAPGLGAGLKTPQIEKLASIGAVAVSAIGLPIQQQVQEIRDLITGGIQVSQNTLATALGITAKDVAEAKKHVNGLYDLLDDRLTKFATVAEAMRSKTLTGAWDIMLSKIQRLVTDPSGFSALKDAINSLSNYIERMNTTTGKMEFNPVLVAQVTTYWNTLKLVGSALSTIASLTAAILPAAIKVGEAFLAWKITAAVTEMQLFSKVLAGMKVLEAVTSIKSMNEALLLTGATASAARSRIVAMSVGARGGLIGLAMWGAYELADYLGAFDNLFGAAEKRMAEFKNKVKENTNAVSIASQLAAVEIELKPILDKHLSSISPRERELLQQHGILKAQLKANSEKSADEIKLRDTIQFSENKKVIDSFLPKNTKEKLDDEKKMLNNAVNDQIRILRERDGPADRALIKEQERMRKLALVEIDKKAPKPPKPPPGDAPIDITLEVQKNAMEEELSLNQNRLHELAQMRDDGLLKYEDYAVAEKLITESDIAAKRQWAEAEIDVLRAGGASKLVELKRAESNLRKFTADAESAARIANGEYVKAREKDGKKEIDDITTKYEALIAVQENYRTELKKSVSQGDVPKAQGDLQDEAFAKRIVQLYRDEQAALKGVAAGNDTVRGTVDKLTASLEKNAIAASKAYRPTWVDGANKAYTNYANAAGDAAAQSEQAFSSMFKGMEDSLTSFVTTGTLDFAKLRDSIIADLVRIQMRAMITSMFSSILGIGGSDATGPPVGKANGAMFDGDMSAFANGGVVNAPTNFAFASGGSTKAGLMGEAGPEAIMPLSRGSDGKLGVKMQGGGQTIQITNAPVINIDARSDQAQVYKMVSGAVQQGNAQLVDTLQRRGVL